MKGEVLSLSVIDVPNDSSYVEMSLVPYEYLVYLFDSLPYRKDKNFDYTSYLSWADGIRERVKEHISNKFAN